MDCSMLLRMMYIWEANNKLPRPLSAPAASSSSFSSDIIILQSIQGRAVLQVQRRDSVASEATSHQGDRILPFHDGANGGAAESGGSDKSEKVYAEMAVEGEPEPGSGKGAAVPSTQQHKRRRPTTIKNRAAPENRADERSYRPVRTSHAAVSPRWQSHH